MTPIFVLNAIADRFSRAERSARYCASSRLASLLLAAVIIAGCQTQNEVRTTIDEPAPIYTLGPGDRVRVTVYQRTDLSGAFEIDSGGRVSLPLLRGVAAEGLTVSELEDAIIEQLENERFKDPKVSVDLVKSRPVCVLGEVKEPDCFDYVYGMRAAAAIALSKGYTYRARKDEITIIRANGEHVVGGHELRIYPGDVIQVSERLF